MKFHPKFTDMFSRNELDLIEKFATVRAWSKEDEIYSLLVDADTVYAEVYADDPTSPYVRIMCFYPDGCRITRGELLLLLKQSHSRK